MNSISRPHSSNRFPAVLPEKVEDFIGPPTSHDLVADLIVAFAHRARGVLGRELAGFVGLNPKLQRNPKGSLQICDKGSGVYSGNGDPN
jgi:hypothetical protein